MKPLRRALTAHTAAELEDEVYDYAELSKEGFTPLPKPARHKATKDISTTPRRGTASQKRTKYTKS